MAVVRDALARRVRSGEEGGAIIEPGCAFDRVRFEFEDRPELARWLLGIRHTLERGRDDAELASARSSLIAFLPPGLHD